MRLLPLFLLLLVVFPPIVIQPSGIAISPSQSYYFRGQTITISGKLTTPSGPIANKTVYLYINDTLVSNTITAEDGSFAFSYQIPLNRPVGTYMNVTVYYPGDLFTAATRDSEYLLIYGQVLIKAVRDTGETSSEIEFSGTSTHRLFFEALFDNGTPASIDRYISAQLSTISTTSSNSYVKNDTSSSFVSFTLDEPMLITASVTGYLNIPYFVFTNNSTKASIEARLLVYDPVNVTLSVSGDFVGNPITVNAIAVDAAGYVDALASALNQSTLQLVTPEGTVEPDSVSVSTGTTYATLEATFEDVIFRGGKVYAQISIPLPEVMKLVQLNSSSAYIELLNVTVLAPESYPISLPVYFYPYVINELDGSKRPFDGSVTVISGDATVNHNATGRYFLNALSNSLELLFYRLVNSPSAYFMINQTITLSGVSVDVHCNATGDLRIYGNETITIAVNVTPWDFEGISAIAKVKVGSESKLIEFNGSFTLSIRGDQIDNGTYVVIRVGNRRFEATVYLIGSVSNPQPSPASQASSGQTWIAIATMILLIALLILVVYLIYLLIQYIKGRFSWKSKKGHVIPEHERILQRLRALYQTGNYKLLAIEAYNALVKIVAPRLGVKIKPNDTPRRVAEKLIAAGLGATNVMFIVEAYEIAKYSPWDLDDETAQRLLAIVAMIIKEVFKKPVETKRRRFLWKVSRQPSS